jgi:uncharacterized membrane protein YqhA
MLKTIERIFEGLLWKSRLLVIIAVVASILAGMCLFFVASVDVVRLLRHVAHYADSGIVPEERNMLRAQTTVHVVEIIDGYLLATVMLIFAFGLYELFISRIDSAEDSDLGSRVLLIRTLDDLKDRLAKVILLILVVKFFESAIQMKFDKTLDLLYLASGILFLSVALYLSHRNTHPEHQPKTGASRIEG